MKHLYRYNNENEYSLDSQVKPFVAYLEEEDICLYNEVNYAVPLFFEAHEDMTVKFVNTYSQTTNYVLYSFDSKNWKSLDTGVNSPTIKKGEKIYFRAYNPYVEDGIGTFQTSGRCDVGGNVMSMISNNFKNATSLGYYNLSYLFKNATKIVNADKLLLPATTLTDYAYRGMFEGCLALLTAPELPATTLTEYCYHSMFKGCARLITAPKLPSLTLANDCYGYMFQQCDRLITAPLLPATTAAPRCYQGMFFGCYSLTNAPTIKLTTLHVQCCQYMFKECTLLVKAPVLRAHTLVDTCYNGMFTNCSSLAYIKALCDENLGSGTSDEWVSGVASSGTFVMSSHETWNPEDKRGSDGIPNGWTVETAAS